MVFLLLRLLAAKMSLQRRYDADELLVAAPQQREQLLLRELEQPLLEGQDLHVSPRLRLDRVALQLRLTPPRLTHVDVLQRLHLLRHVQVLRHHRVRLALAQRGVLLYALLVPATDVLQRAARRQRGLLRLTPTSRAHLQHPHGRSEDLRRVHNHYASGSARAPTLVRGQVRALEELLVDALHAPVQQ